MGVFFSCLDWRIVGLGVKILCEGEKDFVGVSEDMEGRRMRARPRAEPIAARAWRIGRRPIARAPKEEGFCVHEKGVKYRDNMVEAREFWRFYGLQTGIGD